MSRYKPEGYPSLAPYMIVENGEESLSFIERVFGGKRLRTFPDENGKFYHAEIRVGDAVIMLADGGNGWEAAPSYLHLYVEDVDAIFEQAVAAGAEPLQRPEKKDDADKRGGFKAPGGITWWVATQIDQD